MSRSLLLSAIASVLVACGLEQPHDSVSAELVAPSAPSPKLAGRYLGTLTVTGVNAPPSSGCDAVGKVNSTGLEFASDGQVIGWIGHGGWFPNCTTTYAGLSVVVACTGGLSVEYRLDFDANAENVTGTYALSGSVCADYRGNLALARSP